MNESKQTKDLREIKRAMKIQLLIYAFIISIGALIIGARTNHWLLTAEFAIALYTVLLCLSPIIYSRGKQRALSCRFHR